MFLDIFHLHDPNNILTHFLFILFGRLWSSKLSNLMYNRFNFSLKIIANTLLFLLKIINTISIIT